MCLRLLKSVLIIALFFAFQISAIAGAKQSTTDAWETGIKKDNNPYHLYAETGASLHLSALKLPVTTGDAFLKTEGLSIVNTCTHLYSGKAFPIAVFQFYRLILFPFHGFW
jgi:hypothetical protein